MLFGCRNEQKQKQTSGFHDKWIPIGLCRLTQPRAKFQQNRTVRPGVIFRFKYVGFRGRQLSSIDRKWILPRPPGTNNAPCSVLNFNAMVFISFSVGFSEGSVRPKLANRTTPNLGMTRQSLMRNKGIVLDFTYLALFRNDNDRNASDGKPTIHLHF